MANLTWQSGHLWLSLGSFSISTQFDADGREVRIVDTPIVSMEVGDRVLLRSFLRPPW